MSEQDTEHSAVVTWFEQHRRAVTIGTMAVAVIAAGVWLTVSSARNKERFAAAALEQARQSAEAGNYPLASSQLQRVIDTYRGTDAALKAAVSINMVRLSSGQANLAAQDLEKFLASNPPKPIAVKAQMLRGAALEDLGKPAEAGAAYLAAAAAGSMDFEKANALLAAGRALGTAGDTAGAIKALEEILAKYKETGVAGIAEVRLGEITARPQS